MSITAPSSRRANATWPSPGSERRGSEPVRPIGRHVHVGGLAVHHPGQQLAGDRPQGEALVAVAEGVSASVAALIGALQPLAAALLAPQWVHAQETEQAGEEMDQAVEDGRTPLYMAAENGHHEVVAALIAARANVDLAMNDGFTPLLVAAQNGHHEVVAALINANATVDQAMKDGSTPLLMAAMNGHLEVVTALVNANATVDKAYEHGATPLYMAAGNGHHEVVTALIAANATVDKAANGATPLFIAAENGHKELVREALGEGRGGLPGIRLRTLGPQRSGSPFVSRFDAVVGLAVAGPFASHIAAL